MKQMFLFVFTSLIFICLCKIIFFFYKQSTIIICYLKAMRSCIFISYFILLIFFFLLTLNNCFNLKQTFEFSSHNAQLQFDELIVASSTSQTYQLYQKIKFHYGKNIISGQTTKYYDQLKQIINASPVIQGFDMQNYSPHNPWFGWKPVDDGTIDKAIQWYQGTNKKGIVSFQWHWFSPMGGQERTSTFYTNNTDFNISKAIASGTEEYAATLRDIDAIAVQLKRLRDQKIPILWRPLHEAGGGWFWWGSKTSKQTLRLYDIIQDRIINYHKIYNLIWIWSTPEPSWYPGHAKLDMIGFDSYPGDYNYTCQQFRFDSLMQLVESRKMVQLTQNGPIPNFSDCLSKNITWGYFMSWAQLVVQQNSQDHIKAIYDNKLVLTIQKLTSQNTP